MSVPTTTLTIAATKTGGYVFGGFGQWVAVGHGQVYGSFYGGVNHFGAYDQTEAEHEKSPFHGRKSSEESEKGYRYQSGYVAFHISFFSEGCPDSFYGMFKHVNHGGPPSVYHNNDG